MADPTNTITVINKDTGATIGSYSTMTDVMAVTTAGGNFEWVFDGEITKGTGSGFKTTAASITISGKGKYTGDNFWFGNDGASAATHVTVSEGTDVEFAASGGINFRYDNVKTSSTMIVEDSRFYLPSAQMPGNGLFTVKGYGTTAKTDAEGNTIYGFEMGDGTYAANLQVDNVLTVYDKYGIYEGNVAFAMSNYGFAYFGGLTLKSGKITNARIENSKLQIGMNENNQGIVFAGEKSTAEFIGDSEYYGQLAFNNTDGKFIARDTTVATVTGITVKNKDNGIFISDSVELNITGKINTTTLNTYKDQGVDINNDGTVDDKDALPFTVNKDINNDGEINDKDRLSFTILRKDAVTSTINVTGMETKLTLNDVNRTVNFNVSLTSEDFAAIANPKDTHTLFEIKGIVQKTYTATFEDQTGTLRSVENVIVTDEATQTNGLNSESPLDNVTITIDGNAYTIGETITIDGEGYKISWEALGEDGVKNDLVATHLAPPPITVTAGTTLIGKFETLNDAAAAINGDTTNAEPFAVILNADSELTGNVEFTKDTVFSGTGKITGNQIMFGNKAAKLIPTLIIAEGSDITFNGSYFQGTHNSSDTAATMTINNARLFAGGDAKWHGTIKVTGSGARDADGNIIYGFKGAADSEYKENLYVKQNFGSQDRYATLNRDGLLLTAGAWVSIKGGYTMSDDSGSLYNITDSKLTVDKYADIVNKDTIIKVMGDSVVSFGQLGYASATAVSAGAAVINVSGLQSEISAGSISAAITEINFTLTAAEVGALTDSYTLFELTDAAAAFDANTAISVMIDGASYKLNDRITINDSIFEVALGGTDDNDLMLELLAKKPDLSACDVYVGNLTGKDAVAVRDTVNKLTVFESDGTMSVPVWGLGDWDMLDIADVNGDGVDDILISYQHDNGVTGVAALINQKDGSYGMVHQDIRGWSNDLWEYLCSADVNGDGTEDILTIETDSIAAGRDKNVNAWIMDSTGQYSEDMRICGKNTDWEIEGFGDVTGDGKADGILRFKKLVAFWEHDGKNDSVLKEVGQMSTSWKVIGSDDFTGDGLADILFGNSSAQYKLWTDIDEKSYTEINLGTMKNSSLELAGIGDFNGDGKADILWQAADGGLHWGEAQAGKLNNLTTIA